MCGLADGRGAGQPKGQGDAGQSDGESKENGDGGAFHAVMSPSGVEELVAS